MKLFLPQKTLEEWALDDKADLQDGKLLVKDGNTTHTVSSAVHFQKLVSGEDSNGLLGRVKTTAQLTSLNAEHFADSCIIGEAAYEVVEGFVTEVIVTAPPRADPKKKAASPEADLLAAFILDKL
ncbi:MAG: hypothetical protein DI536_11125 [Archangium gephyra]|uniref:Uncharacterized protein n=1 Tax=Archangium gephyra TaxID=48 RepID=A0A2W5TM54_9BACT|nr:MAG: hypothetical protein DI536_11125 [Archangium gephyra]